MQPLLNPRHAILLFSLLSTGLLPRRAEATLPDQFGMGADHIGMANAGTILAADPSAAYYNPAGIGQARHIILEASYLLGQTALWDFHDIVYDVNGDGMLQDLDGYPDHGDVGTDYRVLEGRKRAPFGIAAIQVGALFPIWKRVTVGLAATMPTASLMRVEIQNPSIPYYVMWKNRNNRFTLNPALSIQPVKGVYLGIGTQVMTDMVATGRMSSWAEIEAFPSKPNEDGTEIQGTVRANIDQLVLSLKPRTAFNLGFLLDFGAFVRAADPARRERFEALERFAIGAAWRGEWLVKTDADILMTANGHIRYDDQDMLLSSLLKEPIQVEIQDLVGFYNPPQLSVGMRHGYGPLTLAADMTWAQWSKFTEMASPYMKLDIESLAGASFTVESGSDLGKPAFKDTISFRSGGFVELGPYSTWDRIQALSFFLRGGFGFTPTPVPDQTGLSSYMDSDRTVYAAGLGLEARRIKGFSKGPIRLDFGGQYQVLESRTMIKDRDLLADQDDDGILDYPQGWPLSGSIRSGGSVWVLSAGIEMKFAEPRAGLGERPPQELQQSPSAPPRDFEPLPVPAPAPTGTPTPPPPPPPTEAPAPATENTL